MISSNLPPPAPPCCNCVGGSTIYLCLGWMLALKGVSSAGGRSHVLSFSVLCTFNITHQHEEGGPIKHGRGLGNGKQAGFVPGGERGGCVPLRTTPFSAIHVCMS